jgi:fatty acid desaturase
LAPEAIFITQHARGTVSHYGRVYNFLFLNDGYHVEHHASPSEHWTRLPRWVDSEAVAGYMPTVMTSLFAIWNQKATISMMHVLTK